MSFIAELKRRNVFRVAIAYAVAAWVLLQLTEVLVELLADGVLAVGIDGTPLMQMVVFGSNGQVVVERGPLRVARIAPEAGSPLQVLITNEGASSGVFTLSCSADRLSSPHVDLNPLPDSAMGQ